MRSPKPQQEDPAVVEAREREQRRAEVARTEETQAYLTGATTRRIRRFGKVSSGGSVPIFGGGSTPSQSTGSSGGGGSGGAQFGGGRGGGGGLTRPDLVLY